MLMESTFASLKKARAFGLFILLYPSSVMHADDPGKTIEQAVKSTKLEVDASLDDSHSDVVVNIGDQPVGSMLDLRVVFHNKSSTDLDVDLVPSCGCTKPGIDRLVLASGEKLPLDFSIKIPSIEQAFSVALKCIDAKSNAGFNITVTGRIVAEMVADPKVTERLTSDKSPIKLRISSPFPSIEIQAATILSPGFELISHNVDSGALTLEVGCKEREFHEIDRIVFSISKRDGKSALVPIEVLFLDRIDVTPKKVVLRDEGEELKGVVLVKGAGVSRSKDGIALSFASGETEDDIVPCSIESIRERNPDMLVVFFKLPSSKLNTNVSKPVLTIKGINNYGTWEQRLLVSSFRR